MTLINKTAKAELPEMMSQEDIEDPMVPVRLFCPSNYAAWYLIEYSAVTPSGMTRMAFALCDLGLGYPELGEVSIEELESIRGPLGLGIERDLCWTRKPLSAVQAELHGVRQ